MKGRGLFRAAALALGLLVPHVALANHGATLYSNGNGARCDACHTATPDLPRKNGALNASSAVLDHVFPGMGCGYANGLTTTEREHIASYLLTRVNLVPAINISTPANTDKEVDLGKHVYVGGLAFNSVQITNLTVGEGSFIGTWTSAGNAFATPSTYTLKNTFRPATNFVGTVTFNFRGIHTTPSPDLLGLLHTATITVGAAPNITSSATPGGTVGSPTTYTFTANNPATFSVTSGSTPTGMTVGATSIFGTPTSAGPFTFNLHAENALGADDQSVTYTIARGTPTVSSFPGVLPQTFVAGGTFSLNPAVLSPALAQTQIDAIYQSQTPGVCTTPGTSSLTVTMVAAGTCTIRARTVLSTNWFASPNFIDIDIAINPGTKTITFAPTQSPASQPWANAGTFPINPVATISPPTEPITYGTSTPALCSVSGTTVTTLRATSATPCTITASSGANANYNAAAQKVSTVAINPVAPSAPAIGAATPANQQASIAFTPLNLTNDGGAAIATYNATCNPGGFTGQNTTSPVIVTGLTNGQSYSCSVTATQVAPHSLTSAPSGTVNVTPANFPAITSANNTTFTVLQAGTFNITATGSPAPTILLSGTLPSGITFNGPGGSPRTLSGTPASGTAGTYPLVITADGVDPDATQNFTLTIARRNQTVDFTDPSDTTFGSGNVALAASATSGLPITFTSLTPSICGISGANATLLDVGDCTIRAEQVGNPTYPDWNSAFQDQTFTIAKGNQVITFNTQSVTSRAIVPGGTFAVAPAATTNAVGLAIVYTTADATVCSSVGGTGTITMNNTGLCRIIATQSGNSQWNAASSVNQDVTLTASPQSITFPAQGAKSYSAGGTFAVVGVSASSGLPVSYFSNTPSICTVADPLVATVTIVTAGACSIRAEQGGNNNFAAATPVSGTIQINPLLPGAPTIGVATSGNQHAKISFTAPASDGGSPIIAYRATCGAIIATGSSSPVTVTGLTNGASYTCTVAAQNAAGFGPESGSVGAMPALQGGTLWAANCQSCHGATPSGARFNAAGSTASTAVLDYAISNNPQMNIPSLNALNSLERQDLKQYITSFLLSSYTAEDSTTPNPASATTPADKVISLAGHLSLNTVFPDPLGGPSVPGSFTQVAILVPPANGTLTLIDGVEFLYTPNPGFSGVDTFQYRGEGNVTGDTFTFTINVTAAAPVLAVARNGAGTGTVFSDIPTGGIDCGTDCIEAYGLGEMVTLLAVADPGMAFVGWTGACTGSSVACNVTMTTSQSVTATFDFAPIDLTVLLAGAGSGSVTSSPAGIDCGATCTAVFPPNTPVTLTPTPAAGSAFTGWSGACTGAGACIVTMDVAKSVTATFQPTFALTVSKSGLGAGTVTSSPAGIDCGGACSAQFVTNTIVTLTPTPSPGSAFTGWGGACAGTGACVVTMSSARSVTASFTPTYTLTVQKIGNGIGTVTSTPAGIAACGATCTADYLDGTIVNLAVSIGAETDFLGWGGACSGTGPCSVTMNAARTVTANFKSSIALTVTLLGTGSGIVTSAPDGVGHACGTGCTVSFDPNTIVTLGRSPDAGSVFSGWGGACTGSGACVVTMSQSRSVTATFSLASGAQADVSIASHTSTPPGAASVGQHVTFSLVVANNGPAAATGVLLTDTIPAGSTFISARAGCTHNAGTVTCALGSLAAGATTQVDIVVQPGATGAVTNFADVVAAETDPFTFNNASALALPVSLPSNARLGNISTRMLVQPGAGVLIGGFVIGGTGNKTVAIVATGPSLSAYGITNPLANPSLTVVRSSDQAVIATNDDWASHANASQLQGAGLAPPSALEAGILLTLPPGAYTALVSGGSGVSVLGVYEVDQPQVPLINISTRGNVLTGDGVMIGGFVISGTSAQTVAIQGIGPSLTAFGITNPLANPTITLVRASDNAVLAVNDDWQTTSGAPTLQAKKLAPSNARESALLVTLSPGAYTVVMSGVNGTTGVGIIGIYTVD